MTILTEGQHAGEFLISEAPGTRSREEVTIASGADLVDGEVVAENSAGQYVALDPDATDGRESVAGILYGAVDATSAAKAGVIVARDAEVRASSLTWPDTTSDGPGTTALAALGIIAR